MAAAVVRLIDPPKPSEGISTSWSASESTSAETPCRSAPITRHIGVSVRIDSGATLPSASSIAATV